MNNINIRLNSILEQYEKSFKNKEFNLDNGDADILMNAFDISSEMKQENRQYWGRELGMCWQRIVTEIFSTFCPDEFKPAIRIGKDEPCDLIFKEYAIDTKYRIGSGDSGTLKKFKKNGELLKKEGYRPVLLILRTDNLSTAIQACKNGGWEIIIGKDAFLFIKECTGFDVETYLYTYKG